jgi:hypothetical protein
MRLKAYISGAYSVSGVWPTKTGRDAYRRHHRKMGGTYPAVHTEDKGALYDGLASIQAISGCCSSFGVENVPYRRIP